MHYIKQIETVMLEDIIAWVKWMYAQLQSFEDRKFFPKNRAACTTYPSYGSPGFMCDYAPLCSVPDWQMLAGNYDVAEEKPFVLTKPTIEGQPIKEEPK